MLGLDSEHGAETPLKLFVKRQAEETSLPPLKNQLPPQAGGRAGFWVLWDGSVLQELPLSGGRDTGRLPSPAPGFKPPRPAAERRLCGTSCGRGAQGSAKNHGPGRGGLGKMDQKNLPWFSVRLQPEPTTVGARPCMAPAWGEAAASAELSPKARFFRYLPSALNPERALGWAWAAAWPCRGPVAVGTALPAPRLREKGQAARGECGGLVSSCRGDIRKAEAN